MIIKNCPFCGSKSELYEYEADGVTYFTVGCSKCMITTQGSSNEQEVINDWNKRVNEA